MDGLERKRSVRHAIASFESLYKISMFSSSTFRGHTEREGDRARAAS